MLKELTAAIVKGQSDDTGRTENWQDRAMCAQTDPDAFHPARGERGVVATAKRICRMCDVTAECLESALKRPSPPAGVWGGTTEGERRTLRRQYRQSHPDSRAGDA